jgi:hypothetical protein
MKRWWHVAIGAAALLNAGCGKPPSTSISTPEPEMKNGHPVVHLPPVETHPFEDGYNVGFEYGKRMATPKMPIPSDAEAQGLAHEQAGGLPERTERWQRGFAEGYADGVRNVVTGQK